MRSSMFVVLNEHSEVLLQGFKGEERGRATVLI